MKSKTEQAAGGSERAQVAVRRQHEPRAALVEALTRAGRHDRSRLEEARLIFERMLGFANHVGLYAEETGHRGEALGNFPQGFTHLALVSAAFNLDRALGPADDSGPSRMTLSSAQCLIHGW
jgi:hypothetical protein